MKYFPKTSYSLKRIRGEGSMTEEAVQVLEAHAHENRTYDVAETEIK